MIKARLLLPLLVGLAACSSAPSTFYTLAPEPAVAPAATRSGAITVAFGAVNLPGALDRPQLARRNGDNEIDYSETERWAAPLDDMTRHVLASDLATRLPPGMVLVAGGPPPPPARTIAVDISRFDAGKDGRVTLVARWQILGPVHDGSSAATVTHAATIAEPGGSTTAAVVAAMSRAAGALADDIARTLR